MAYPRFKPGPLRLKVRGANHCTIGAPGYLNTSILKRQKYVVLTYFKIQKVIAAVSCNDQRDIFNMKLIDMILK
jgi:hypothetical protein